MKNTVQLAMYKGSGNIANAIIRWWTKSKYSHCELVINGVCYSSSVMDGGIREKNINLTSDKWDVIDLPWADEKVAFDYFKETDHHRYGYIGLIRNQLFNRNRKVNEAQFCSEWCANAIKLPNAPSYSPASLARICEFINKQK